MGRVFSILRQTETQSCVGRGVIHFNLIKTSHASHGCLPGREAAEVEKGGNTGCSNNSGPTGDGPVGDQQPGEGSRNSRAAGLPWAFGFACWWSVGLKSLREVLIVMGPGERQTLRFLPWTSSRNWGGEGKVGMERRWGSHGTAPCFLVVEGRLPGGPGISQLCGRRVPLAP